MSKRLIGLDIETYDPCLKTRGYSWKYNEGYILNTALYYEDTDEVKVIAGLHNENCPFTREHRVAYNQEIIDLLKDPNVSIVGANLQYDIGWLLYEYEMTTYDVKCSFIDVLQAEAILNEFDTHSLEEVSWKYLQYGKTKDRIEDWVKENISSKGDFRQYLKDAPWDLLCEYVKGDAKNPVKVWKKQLEVLKRQGLCERCKLEFDCILPTLQMTMNGMPFDDEQREKNLKELILIRDKVAKEFSEKYGVPNFNVNSSAKIAEICDKHNVPYKCKITLKGYNGKTFSDYKETDAAFARAKKLVSEFRFVKSIPVAYVPSKMAERTVELLQEEGFILNCSPNVDKKFFNSQRDNYEVIALIADWKLANGIISKILGDKYTRFICPDGKIRPQFKITDSTSFRYSSVTPNCIDEDTLILTENGYKPLYELSVGYRIYNGNGDLTKIKHIWYKGKRNCLSLVSANGNEVICTPEHKFWNGKEWLEGEKLNVTDIVKERTDSVSIQENVNNTPNRRSTYAITSVCRIDTTTRTRRRVSRTEETTQTKNGSCIHKPSTCKAVCRRIYFRGTTFIQRLVSEIQGITEQRKKFFESIFDRRTESGTAQSKSSTSEVQIKRNEWEETGYIQRRMFRQKGLHNCLHKGLRLCKKNIYAQKSCSRCFRHIGRTVTKEPICTPYRPQPLKQQLGQLGSMYTISSQTVTQTVKGVRRVYDIEVESEDHSFIANGFRIKNCQQIPSKGSLKTKDGEYSFPAHIRTLVKSPKGCVFGKIDYGQIEYRLICNIACGKAGEEVRAEYMKNPKLDFHQFVVDLTGLSRKYAKNMSFGVSFGMGLKSMAESFGWTMEQATEISEQYHEYMPFVQPTLELVGDVAKQRGYIKTVGGSHARLPNPNKSYTMLNRYTQGSGAECLKKAITTAYKEGIWERLKVANTVHDELNVPYTPVSKEGVLDLYRLAEIMRTVYNDKLRIPLEAEPEYGADWYNVHLYSEWLELKEKEDEEWENTTQEVKDFTDLITELVKNKELVLP